MLRCCRGSSYYVNFKINSMKWKYFLLFFILIWPFCLVIFGQNYSYKQYTVFDGLPQNQLTSLYQDKDGFIWLASKGGISRFDGKNFKKFHIQNEPPGYISGFFEFNKQLFCYTRNKIARLQGNAFQVVYADTATSFNVVSISNDSSKIIISATDYIGVLSASGIRKIINSDKNHGLSYIHFFNDLNFVFSWGNKGIYHYYGRNKPLKLVMKGFSINLVTEIGGFNTFLTKLNLNIEKNEIKYGVYKYDNHKLKKIFEPKFSVFRAEIFTPEKKLILSCDNSNWLKIDTNGNVLDKDCLPNTTITCIIEDKKNNLWFATENGLFYLQSYAFRNYGEKSGMPPYVWSIFEAKDSAIVFASFYNILKSLKNGEWRELNDFWKVYPTGSNFYFSGFCSSKGFWYMPSNFGLLIYEKGKFVFIDKELNNDNNTTILSTYEDTLNQMLFLGGTGGLYVHRPAIKTWKNYKTEGSNVLAIEKDKYDRLWICTGKKILLFKDTIFLPFKNNEIPVHHGVISCKRDFRGNMWLASKSGLWLHQYHRKIKVCDGLFFFISMYKNKFLLTGGVHGLLIIDLEKFYNLNPEAAQFFDRYNGFIGKECGQNGTCVDSKGNVWIPTSESVVLFNPEKVIYDTVPPKSFIYDLEASKSDLQWKLVKTQYEINDSPVMLNYKFANILIHFHALHYPCQERVRYKYRLLGYNDAWTETDANSEHAVFTNLEPGNYTFEVLACNENRFWNTKPTVVKFRIVPAFWQTIFFKIAMFLILLVLVAYSIYYFMQRKRQREIKEQQVEQQLVAMQMNAMNAQLDPHFVFNAITAIGSEVQGNNTERAYQYFVKVSKLLRKSLKDANKLSRKLDEEIQFVENYLVIQKYRFEERFDYLIEVDKNVDLNFLIPKMCIQIFVENAIKHGLEHRLSDGKLNINVFNDQSMLNVIVEDNGIGRAASAALKTHSTGVGLKVFKDFFEIMNRYNNFAAGFEIVDLYSATGHAAGTRVILHIPFDYQILGK